MNGVRGICCGGGERAKGSGVPLLRRCIVRGGVFLKELCFLAEEVLEKSCGWGFTTATLGAPECNSTGGGGGRSSESGGGGGKSQSGGGEGKSVLGWRD